MEEKKLRCEDCDRNFKGEEGLQMHNSAKHPSNIPKGKTAKVNFKKMRNWFIFLIIIGLIFYGFFWTFSGIKTLPPTTMQGHVEQSPISHVLKTPMPLAVQKHMLEHADGTGPGGVIINYNCEDYECEDGLIENLESFAEEFPSNVYVAPFKNMDAKIVLTRLNRIEILEEYNRNKIYIFISGRVPFVDGQDKVEESLTKTTSVKEFNMTAKQWQFSPNKIEVNEGDTVILNIKSIDVSHGIAIPQFDVDEFLSPGNEVRIEFLANRKGSFFFACSVSCGVGHGGMTGKIIVN